MRKTYKFYEYKHPKTEEVFREIREFNDKDRPYEAPDGTMCPRKPRPGEKSQPTQSTSRRRDDEPPLRPVHIKL